MSQDTGSPATQSSNTADSGPKVPMGAMAYRPHMTSAGHFSELHLALINSYILDSGATEHVCNDRSCFTTYRLAAEDDLLVVGIEAVRVEGWGDIIITMDCEITPEIPTRKRPFVLYEVAHVLSFTANMVLYNRFYNKRIF